MSNVIPIIDALRAYRAGQSALPAAGRFVHYCPADRDDNVCQAQILSVSSDGGLSVQNMSFIDGRLTDDVKWLPRHKAEKAVVYLTDAEMRDAFAAVWPRYAPKSASPRDFEPQQPQGTTQRVMTLAELANSKVRF